MELSDVIVSRRSIRKFKQENISADTVRLLLDAARLAPSGSNLQPARFIVAQSQDAKEALGQCTPYKFIVKASVVFVCCADLTAISKREKRVGELLEAGAFDGVEVSFDNAAPYATAVMETEAIKAYLAMNVAIAVEHIVLKAVDLGLGSCWLGRFDRDKLKEYLQQDDSIYPVVLLPVGYPDQTPKARPRFDLDKLILKTI
jgi:nitroreductase